MKSCPKCHATLAEDAPEGLCPRCLAAAAFASEPTVVTGGAVPDIADAEEVARRLPQYEILELLGRGGMGVVYKARQKQLDRTVALKILPPGDAVSPDFVERFRREAQSLAKLSHPNIVAVHDFGECGGLYYFAMEYVDGVNLRQMIRGKQMTAAEALAVVPKICDALQYAHDEGVVHRDIKPENILVDTRGRVKIADFGLAKLLRREDDFNLTLSGMALGTPRYMAPEQVEKPESVDHRADIYSLGVVFYEMLTGELPMGRFAPPSQKVQIDVRLDEVVLHTLEKEPSLRYQQASQVKTDVENISGILEKLPPSLRAHFGFDYQSKRTLFGLPLLHVATGVDPVTGKARVARGIVAIGAKASGVIACGGMARGVIAMGGIATGGIAMGGLTFGIVSMGGLALAVGLAYGGVAVGPIAMGGVCAGYLAGGGLAFGVHAGGGRGGDHTGREFVRQWFNPAMITFFVLFALMTIVQALGIFHAKRMVASAPASTPPPGAPPARSRNVNWGMWIMFMGTVFGGTLLLLQKWRAPEPIFYTFSSNNSFVKGNDGPEVSDAIIDKFDLTPAQIVELNRVFQRAYNDFVSLERRHTDVTRDEGGAMHIKIAAFPDESFALAQRVTGEVRGLLGRDAVPLPRRGEMIRFGLFRHGGEAEVRTDLWKDSEGTYHYTEVHGSREIPGGVSGGQSRSGDGKNWRTVFPEEYHVYWKE